MDPCLYIYIYRGATSRMSASFIRAVYSPRISFGSKSPICRVFKALTQQIANLPSFQSFQQKQLRPLLLTVQKMHVCTDDGALMLESVNGIQNFSHSSKEALLQEI